MEITLPDGKYKILRQLGKGGQGGAYLAENKRLGTLWAVKTIRKSGGNDLPVEIEILRKLDHPALPRIIDLLEDDEYYYMISDYIEGNSLNDELSWVGKFDEEKVVGWMLLLCGVLEYLHSMRPGPIVHRDLKPSNLILTKNGELKLIDFGIANEMIGNDLNETMNLGTAGYAPPERYNGQDAGPASDIYSMGVLAFHLLTGIGPSKSGYERKPLVVSETIISDGLTVILHKCMAVNPNDRFCSAAELASALRMTAAKNKRKPVQTAEKSVCYKNSVVSIPDNYEFACELAYCAAAITGLNVLLLDTGTYSGLINGYFQKRKSLEIEISDESGNEIKCECADHIDNLHMASVRHTLNRENAGSIINACKQRFDMLVIHIGKLMSPEESAEIIARSGICLATVGGDLASLRSFAEYSLYMRGLKSDTKDKYKFVLFDGHGGNSMDAGQIRELVGNDLFLGEIPHWKQREYCRNNLECFAESNFNRIKDGYSKIIRSLSAAADNA